MLAQVKASNSAIASDEKPNCCAFSLNPRLPGPRKLSMLSVSGEPLSNDKHRMSDFTIPEYVVGL